VNQEQAEQLLEIADSIAASLMQIAAELHLLNREERKRQDQLAAEQWQREYDRREAEQLAAL
jgi:hypothetical protein